MKDNNSSSGRGGEPVVLGLLSLVIGIIGFATPVLALVGLVLGIVGLVRKNRKALCIIGIVISILAFLVSVSNSSGRSGTISSGKQSEQAASSAETETPKAESSVTDNRKNASGQAEDDGSDNIEVSADDFDVREYPYEDSIGDTLYFLVIKNNSKATVDISGNGTAMDASGNALGAGNCELDVLGPGEESITYFYFGGVTGIDHVNYDLNYAPENYYDPVISNISLSETVNDSNLTVTATNNGDEPANFVEAYALFMDSNDHVIGYSSNYITDGDMSLQPGASLSAQLDAYDAFDHVDCYITGRADRLMNAVVQNSDSGTVPADQFAVEEHLYQDSYSTTDYLVITNNSDQNVSIFGNATALDSSGASVGAADCSIDVLGPGEQSIAYFYFGGVQNVDHVDYQLTYSVTNTYKPVISDLSTAVSVNNENAVVSVTNNGSEAAQFVEVYGLFYDASGKVVYATSSYTVDDDSELKPGTTLTAQLDSFEPFDHVEVYLTGRRY